MGLELSEYCAIGANSSGKQGTGIYPARAWGKHSGPDSHRMNKMVRLGITAAVKAEKMVGSCRQAGLTGFLLLMSVTMILVKPGAVHQP